MAPITGAEELREGKKGQRHSLQRLFFCLPSPSSLTRPRRVRQGFLMGLFIVVLALVLLEVSSLGLVASLSGMGKQF